MVVEGTFKDSQGITQIYEYNRGLYSMLSPDGDFLKANTFEDLERLFNRAIQKQIAIHGRPEYMYIEDNEEWEQLHNWESESDDEGN